MNSVRNIQQLNKRELEAGITPEGSWHTDYRDTAFIYIGGLPFELSEGDIITICSQYGEPVWIKLARDRETGKSRGFAWVKYEDQRSCDLAVDNLGGANIMDRTIRVDHARYKPRDDEDMRDNTMGELDIDPGPGSDDDRRKRRKTESESEEDDEERPMLPEEIDLERLLEKLDEEDPMRDAMVKRQQEKVDEALKKLKKQQRKEKDRARRKDKHRHRDDSRDRERWRLKGTEDDRHSKHSRRRDDRSKSRGKYDDKYADEDRRRRSRTRDSSEADRRKRTDGSHERRDKPRSRRDEPRNKRDRSREREYRRSRSIENQKRSRSGTSPLPYRARSPR